MLFARARAPFVINMWEGEAKVGLSCPAYKLSPLAYGKRPRP